MKKMACEMCGGSDLMKQDGVFVCQSCGSKYSVEEARKMMVEINGPIQVEGIANIENLLTRAREFEKTCNYEKALEYYNKILDLDVTHIDAKKRYDILTSPVVEGKIYDGVVKEIKEYGVFVGIIVEILPYKDGLCHISELANTRIYAIENICKIGDVIKVKCIMIDERGGIKLSRKEALREGHKDAKILAEEKFNEEKRRQEEQQQLETQRRTEQSNLWVLKGLCRHCGGNIGGLLFKKCKSCGK